MAILPVPTFIFCDVMSTRQGLAECEPGEHIVQFYERDPELARAVAAFLSEALRAGGTALAIATPTHRSAFLAELERLGVDASRAAADGSLVWLDAADTLSSFTQAGQISPTGFAEQVGGLIRTASNRGGPVHAYGEMVALLWEAGHVVAAIELEELWNRLAHEVSFSLLCAYRQSAVSDPKHAGLLQQVCHLHSCVREPEPRDRVELATELGPEPDSPAAARALLAQALAECGHPGGRLAEDARLLLSELVTNAVLHARSSVSVAVRCDRSSVHLSVRDRNPGPISLQERGEHTGLGVGLQIVGSLSSDWGVDPAPEGKTVWATLNAAA